MGIQYHGVVVFFCGKYFRSTGRRIPMARASGSNDCNISFDWENDFWGKRKWFAPIGFGLMFLLSVYASYGMRENSIFNQIDLQTITLFFIGAIASVIGIVLGYAFFTVEKNTPKSE